MVEMPWSTMNSSQVYDTLCKMPTSKQPCLGNSLYDILPSASLYKMAESIETKEHSYYALCEAESIGPVYCTPSSIERKVYEEFEGKRFRILHHKDIM